MASALSDLAAIVHERHSRSDHKAPPHVLVVAAMARARDFDPNDSFNEESPSHILGQILRDGPEVGVFVVAWFDRSFALGLSAAERADLTAYLEAVGAVDRREDDRSRARRMVETFVYLGLLVDGEARDDRGIWNAAIDAALAEIARHPRAAAVEATIAELEARLRALAARVNAGAPLPELRPEVIETRRRLIRLAADWAGALAGTTMK